MTISFLLSAISISRRSIHEMSSEWKNTANRVCLPSILFKQWFFTSRFSKCGPEFVSILLDAAWVWYPLLLLWTHPPRVIIIPPSQAKNPRWQTSKKGYCWLSWLIDIWWSLPESTAFAPVKFGPGPVFRLKKQFEQKVQRLGEFYFFFSRISVWKAMHRWEM